MKATVHNYEDVIIGSTLEALIYSYITGFPVFFAGSRCPKTVEHFEPDFCFPLFEHKVIEKKTNNGTISVGINKEDLWQRLFFTLSLGGLIPITEIPSSFRLDDEHIRIVIDSNKLIKIKPKNIYLFDDLNVAGLPPSKVGKGGFTVYDWLFFNSMYPHNYDIIYTDDNPINELHFIQPTSDIRFKDGCLVSYFKTQKEMERELTEFAISLKMKDIFKQYDIKGKANGVYHMNKSIQRYKKVRHTFIDREVVKPFNIYQDFDNVKFCGYDVKSLVSMMQPNKKLDDIWKKTQNI